jgi:hypothetical protein
MLEVSPPDILLTIAEISVAFAGFASLSTIVGRRLSGEGLEVASGRLAILLITSLATVMLSFAPLVLMTFSLANEVIWQFSAIFAIPLIVGAAPLTIKRLRSMRKLPDFNKLAGLVVALLVVLFFFAMLVGASGVVSSFRIYLVGLLSLLCIGGVMFALVVLTVLAGPESGGSDA